ncbi:MAG: hypothetical protein FJX75_20670 [Armatimonadetes bacterium]|nr:hypothetical protein [Armatimonadota bacterium]
MNRKHLLMMGIALVSVSAMAQDDSWLSIAECGASGSTFETTANATEGSKEIVVADVADFRVGQGVTVSKCNLHFTGGVLWGPRPKHAASRPLGEAAQFRGYDGSIGSWTPYVVDMPPATPHVFRWTADLGRTWSEKTPITGDWQPLKGGVEIKFGTLDWESGYVITFAGRDQLVSVIEKIEGNRLTLRDAANRTAADCVVRHCDDEAIQAAINRAIQEKRNLYFPPGRYKLARGVTVANAPGITLQGANGLDTVLDISDGEGACIRLQDGKEVTLRNLRFIGHSGFAERDQMGHLATQGATGVWGFYFKHCSALGISNTERVLVENCHATRMSAECFYSAGRARTPTTEPDQYTKAITYERCSVVDSARNAFNNNDMAENTSVLHCRIVDVGGCTWEGASRFVRFCDNYVRNSGTVAMGNVRSRAEQYEILGTGQHIVSGNVFESGVCYGGCAIRAAACATQVIISDNVFVNFGSSAVELISATGPSDLPAGIGTISGNLFDMTSLAEKPSARTAVLVSTSDTIVSDNQIYMRAGTDANVTGLRLQEPALNVTVHDNLIRNCGQGIVTARAGSRVAEVVDATTFVPTPGQVPFERRQSHRYRGWNIVWTAGGKAVGTSVVKDFDPETCRFTLADPREVKVGDTFEVFPPEGANWTIHTNTIQGCAKPVVLDSYGSETSWLRDNVIERGGATGVGAAVMVAGRFNLTGNHIVGFDEPGSAALALLPDRLGNPPPNRYRGNILERCTRALSEGSETAWKAANSEGNECTDCGTGL